MASTSALATPCGSRGTATSATRTLPPRTLQRLARSLRCAAAPPDGSQPSLSSPGDSTLSTDLTAFPGTTRAGSHLPARLDQPTTKVEPTPGHADFDWDGWSAFFDELDEAATRVDELEAMIQCAVEEEDYAVATELKQELDAVLAKDSVASVLRALDEALAQEDYSAAARLRDEGGAGLLGWWQGRAGPDDPQGHVLRIEAEFGRYIGTMYKAADLADVKGLSEESFFSPSSAPRSLRDVGDPMMEIFVRPRPDGTLVQQVCALVPAQGEDEGVVQVQGSLVVEEGTDPEELIGKTVGELFGLSADKEQGTIVAEIVDDSDEEEGEEEDDEEGAMAQQGTTLEDNIVSSSALFPFSHGLSGAEEEDMADMLVEGDVLMHRAAAVITVTGRDAFEYEVLRMPEEEGDEASTQSGGEDEEASTSTGNKEILPKLRGSSTTPSDGTPSSALHGKVLHAAKQLAARQRDAGDSGSRADMEHELRRMTRELLKQSYGVSEDAGTLRIERVAIRPSFCERASYRRLAPSGARTDPLSGLFLGAFGMHGPELLQLSRGLDEEGEEMVFCTKVTGDENVPAGSVSFKARIGRRHRQDPSEYPPELGVVARYKGQGRIAMQGFTNPKWVDGELLQFSRNNSPATRNADLGFVWSMPQGSKYLILLNRLDDLF